MRKPPRRSVLAPLAFGCALGSCAGSGQVNPRGLAADKGNAYWTTFTAAGTVMKVAR